MRKRKFITKANSLVLSTMVLISSVSMTGIPAGAAGEMDVSDQFYATKDQLLAFNTAEYNQATDEQNSARILFGKNPKNSKPASWWVAGSDEEGGSITLYAAESWGDHTFNSNSNHRYYNSETGEGSASETEGYDEVYGNHYGASGIRQWLKGLETTKFTDAEQSMMGTTRITMPNNIDGGDTSAGTHGKVYAIEGEKLYLPASENHKKTYVSSSNHPDWTLMVGDSDTEEGTDGDDDAGGTYRVATGFFKNYLHSNEKVNTSWLRSPSPTYTTLALYAYYDGYVNNSNVYISNAVVPALKLDLTSEIGSSVIFASAASAANPLSEGATLATEKRAMELKFDGTQKDLGTATVSNQKIHVTGASNDATLVVQYDDKFYSQAVSGDTMVSASTVGVTDFSKSKVWLEKHDDDGLAYAVQAEANLMEKVLTSGPVTRESMTNATVNFTSSVGGSFYYQVLPKGADVPDQPTGSDLNSWTSDGSQTLSEGENSFAITNLEPGAKDVYIIAVYDDGEISAMLRVTVLEPQLTKPASAQWSSENRNIATWSEVDGATGYSLQLYKNDVANGSAVTTSETSYTFSSLDTTSRYTFTVKATCEGYLDSLASDASAVRPFAITLNTNDGAVVSGDVTSYTYGTTTTLPTDVTKTDHTFGGWYANEDFEGDAVTSITSTEQGDKTYYAKWISNSYSVTLNTNGGKVNTGNITSYAYGVGATLPTNVTKAGYSFVGWYDNEDFEGDAVTAISADDYGHKVFYANWEKLPDVDPDPEPTEATGNSYIFSTEDLGKPKSISVSGSGVFLTDASTVAISWGNLEYSFERRWDSEANKWGDAVWSTTGDNGKITATNYSSEAYDVNLEFHASNSDGEVTYYNNVEGKFYNKAIETQDDIQSATEQATLTLKDSQPKTSYLWLSGNPDKVKGTKVLNNETFGTVTVTLQVAVSDSTDS